VNVVWEDSRNHYTPDHLYQIFARSGIWKTKPTGHWEWEANYDWISEPANNPPAYNDLNPDIAFLSCSGSRVVVWDGEYNYPSDQSRQIWYHKRSADATPPGAPGGLQVSAPGAFVYLYWTPLPVDAKGYNVYRTDGVMPPLPPFQKINAQPVIPAFYYDSTADFGKCYTYKVTALDCAENEGASSNYAGYYGCSTGDQLASVDVGNPAPSSNTVRRSGYYTWGGTPDSTVDYDPDSLVYRFTNLVPDSFYLLGVGYFENNPSRVREQSLHINGVVVHGRCLLPGWPAQMVYLVPRRAYQDGSFNVSFVREQGPNAVVAQLWLYQAHFPGGGPQSAGIVDLDGAKACFYDPIPNPSSGTVGISYSLSVPAWVSLGIYNIAGQKVRTLAAREQSPGKYALLWDGKCDDGNPVPGGVYFCRLNAGDVVFTKRVTLVR
jgi:hypothetical protein